MYCLKQQQSDLPSGSAWLTGAELEVLSRLHVVKRRNDWRLGRWTAKRLLCEQMAAPLGRLAPRDIEIRAEANGAPAVYIRGKRADVTLSISHSHGQAFCVAVVGVSRVGCDTERIEPRSERFVADYFAADERWVIASCSAGDRPRVVTAMWSAKESVLKALREGLRRDTRSVVVTLGLLEGPHEWRTFEAHCNETGRDFSGQWRCSDGYIDTIAREFGSPASGMSH